MDIIPAYNIVDTETTGLNPLSDRIIEIAILRVEENKIVNEFSTLINPHTRIGNNITRITNITQEQLNQAPPFSEIKSEIKELLDGTLLIAHNARFDYAFLKNEFIRTGDPITLKTLCTVRLSRKLFPELKSHSLENIISRFNISTHQRHRALADTKAVYDFLQIAKRQDTNIDLEDAVSSIRKKPAVPRYLNNSDLDDIPEEPGVYIFWADDIALYVGKSVNLKDRVNSHFISDHSTPKDLKISSQIKRIETITTAGELGALLLESRLVKELAPLYNRMLRRDHKPIKVIKDDSSNYLRARIIRGDIDIQEHMNILSTHRSIKKAKEVLHSIAQKYDLCPKFLDLEKGKGSCFNYQLDKCSGACLSEVDNIKYNVRFLEAFSKRQVQKWPFDGTVALIEDNGIRKQAHIVNNWCYLGTLDEEKEIRDLNENLRFDHDMYKILHRYVSTKRSKLKIKEYFDETSLNDLLAASSI